MTRVCAGADSRPRAVRTASPDQAISIRRRVSNAIGSAECPDKQPDPPLCFPFLLVLVLIPNLDPQQDREVEGEEAAGKLSPA